jgi:Ribbon-helix-helix protein, copG family
MSKTSERAASYQRLKDQPGAWDTADVSEPEKGRPLGATLSVRLSPEDMRLLRQQADNAGLSYSELVRRAVEQFIRPRVEVRWDADHNAWVNGSLGLALTIASFNIVGAILSDHESTHTGGSGLRNPAAAAC